MMIVNVKILATIWTFLFVEEFYVKGEQVDGVSSKIQIIINRILFVCTHECSLTSSNLSAFIVDAGENRYQNRVTKSSFRNDL